MRAKEKKTVERAIYSVLRRVLKVDRGDLENNKSGMGLKQASGV